MSIKLDTKTLDYFRKYPLVKDAVELAHRPETIHTVVVEVQVRALDDLHALKRVAQQLAVGSKVDGYTVTGNLAQYF